MERWGSAEFCLGNTVIIQYVTMYRADRILLKLVEHYVIGGHSNAIIFKFLAIDSSHLADGRSVEV